MFDYRVILEGNQQGFLARILDSRPRMNNLNNQSVNVMANGIPIQPQHLFLKDAVDYLPRYDIHS